MTKPSPAVNQPMTYYLNNSGHRWVNIDDKGRRERIPVDLGTGVKQRSVYYWEAIGNFAVPVIRVKGKQLRLCLSDDLNSWTTHAIKYSN